MIPNSSTPIKNEILIDIFAKGLLSRDEMRIVCYIIRWSWGFKNNEDKSRRQDWTKPLSKIQIARDIRMDQSAMGRILNIMLNEKKILEKNGCYQFNEHYDQWKITDTKRGISIALRKKIFERDDYTCVYCGKSLWKNGIKLEVDHIIPISKGGTDDIDNLTTSCRKCNREKSGKLIGLVKNTSLENEKKLVKNTSKTGKNYQSKWYKLPVEMVKNTSSTDLKPNNGNSLLIPKETIKKHIKKLIKKKGVVFQKTIHDFKVMRNKIKKPLTKRAEKSLLTRLEELSPDEAIQIAILEQSIFHCWQDVYPLRDEKQKGGNDDERFKKLFTKNQ